MAFTDGMVIATLVVTVAAAASGWSLFLWERRHAIRRSRLDAFLEYARRYADVMSELPQEAFRRDFDLAALDPDETSRLLQVMRTYFDLCSEEWWLHENGMLEPAIWAEWASGMQHLFVKPAFAQAWDALRSQDYFFGQFREFVERSRPRGALAGER